MPALVPTDHHATIRWLGRVPDRDAALSSVSDKSLTLGFAGVEGEAHSGLNRPACSRVSAQHPRGTEIRNVRQLSILSEEELAEIARAMKVDKLDPGWLGASMVIAGIADFSHLPPSARLQSEGGATLVIDMQNQPCVLPGKVIEASLPGHGKDFKPAAENRRGVTAWVERPGRIHVGDRLRLHVPAQRPWRGSH